MRCEKCGFEYDETSGICPNCSSAAVEPISLNPAADKVIGMLKDNFFLIICILISGATILSIVTGGLPLLYILISVFLWLAYFQGRKGFADVGHLRAVSGVLYANYIIINISAICIIVCGVLLGFLWQVVTAMDMMDETIDEVVNIVGMEYSYMVETLLNISGYLVLGILVAIGVIMLLINVLGFRKIHRLAKSIYQSVDFCVSNFEKVNAAKNWMIVYAVFNLIGGAYYLFNWQLNACISAFAQGVTMILGCVLVNKYLSE